MLCYRRASLAGRKMAGATATATTARSTAMATATAAATAASAGATATAATTPSVCPLAGLCKTCRPLFRPKGVARATQPSTLTPALKKTNESLWASAPRVTYHISHITYHSSRVTYHICLHRVRPRSGGVSCNHAAVVPQCRSADVRRLTMLRAFMQKIGGE